MIGSGHGSLADYVAHLQACDSLFPTPLSARTDLYSYAEKLHERAESFELWDGERLIGLLSAYMDGEVVFISHLCVMREAPKGSGHMLLTQLFEVVRRAGKQRIRLNVEEVNQKAIAFYLRHGFEVIAHIENDLVMERNGQKMIKERHSESV